MSVDHHTVTLMNVVDELATGSIIFDNRGSLLHLSPALDRRLTDSAERGLLIKEARLLAERGGCHTVATAAATYHLRAVDLPSIRPYVERQTLVTVELRAVAASLSDRYRLTPRQVEIAQLLAKGESNRRIAELLQLSVFTVQHHTRGVLQKLGVTRRAAVAARLQA
jgi:DNA-binding NarL/FixJ family response regulator